MIDRLVLVTVALGVSLVGIKSVTKCVTIITKDENQWEIYKILLLCALYSPTEPGIVFTL